MDDGTRISRATAFETIDARVYAAIRPGYPQELFTDIVRYAHVSARSQVLEIGCGTGQATKPLAATGADMICIDPSADMTKVAREQLDKCHNVRVRTSSLEALEVQRDSFDLVFAATAFHWIDSDIRLAKSARLLRRGGTLAIFANTHPRPCSGFYAAAQEVYREIVPEWSDPDKTPTADDAMAAIETQLAAHQSFNELVRRSFDWSVVYDANEFVQLLGTYSDHVRLGRDRFDALAGRLRSMIEQRFDGRVTRPYRTLLCMARVV